MMITQYLGWVANAFLITALWLVGYRWRHAFLLTIVGELLWLAEGIRLRRADIGFLCVVFTLLAWRNWWKWGKEASEEKKEEPTP